MPFDTFTPPVQPGQDGSNYAEIPTILDANFGDGYRQVVLDGINFIRGTATLSWPSLTAANWASMVSFFSSHVSQPFYWTLPDEASPRKWRVSPQGGWKKGWGSPLWVKDCQATFLLDFTPD